MKGAALELRGVTIRYGASAPAIASELSFSLAAGERAALVGLNGSGKTTLLSSLVGLVDHEGEIYLCGERLTSKTVAQVRERVGFVFNVPEDQLLFPRVLDDVMYGLLSRGVSKAEASKRAMQTLEALGIEQLAEAHVHHLSHGQKQRVALAGALVADPELLLLDEPTAGLDPPGRRGLAELLSTCEATMLVATHDLDFATQLCTRLLMLADGEIALDAADASEVKRRWGF